MVVGGSNKSKRLESWPGSHINHVRAAIVDRPLKHIQVTIQGCFKACPFIPRAALAPEPLQYLLRSLNLTAFHAGSDRRTPDDVQPKNAAATPLQYLLRSLNLTAFHAGSEWSCCSIFWLDVIRCSSVGAAGAWLSDDLTQQQQAAQQGQRQSLGPKATKPAPTMAIAPTEAKVAGTPFQHLVSFSLLGSAGCACACWSFRPSNSRMIAGKLGVSVVSPGEVDGTRLSKTSC